MNRLWILRPICALLILGTISACAAPGAEALQTQAVTVPSPQAGKDVLRRVLDVPKGKRWSPLRSGPAASTSTA